MKIKSVKKEEIDAFSRKHWKQFNKERGYDYYEKKPKYFAVFENKKIVGYAKCKIISGICKVSELLVAKEARRKGFGKALLTKIEDYSKKMGCKKIVLKTTIKHKEAFKLYKNLGFKVDAILKNYYSGLNWICMSKK